MNLPAAPPTEWPDVESAADTSPTSTTSEGRLGGSGDDTITSVVIVVIGTIVGGFVAMLVIVGGLLLFIEQQPDSESEAYGYAIVAAFFFVLLCVIPLLFAVLVGWRVRRRNSTAVWPALLVGIAAFPAAAFAAWASIEWTADHGLVPLGWVGAAGVMTAYGGWLVAVAGRLSTRRAAAATAVALVLLAIVGVAGALNAGRHERAQRVELIAGRGVAHALLADSTVQPEVNGWTVHEMTAFLNSVTPKLELHHASGISMMFRANQPSDFGGCTNNQCYATTGLSDGTPVRKYRAGAWTGWEIDRPGGAWVLSTIDDPTDAMVRDLMESMTPVSAETWADAYEIYKPE